eukprot:g2421.t1
MAWRGLAKILPVEEAEEDARDGREQKEKDEASATTVVAGNEDKKKNRGGGGGVRSIFSTRKSNPEDMSTEENLLKAMKYKAKLAKWTPILVIGPFAWIICCLFNLFWGPIISEALYFCTEISTCYENLEISTSAEGAVTSESEICGPSRDFVRYHTWTGFLYLLWNMALLFSPFVGCTCCVVKSLNTIILSTALFLVIFAGGLAFGLAIWNDAQLCRDDHRKHLLYWTVQTYIVELIFLFVALFLYGVVMLWNIRSERKRKKRVLSLMSKKIKFGFGDLQTLRKEEEEEEGEKEAEGGEEEEEEEEEEGGGRRT